MMRKGKSSTGIKIDNVTKLKLMYEILEYIWFFIGCFYENCSVRFKIDNSYIVTSRNYSEIVNLHPHPNQRLSQEVPLSEPSLALTSNKQTLHHCYYQR